MVAADIKHNSATDSYMDEKFNSPAVRTHFYSASVFLAMQSAVLARGILSVGLSVRHIPVLCPDK